MRSKIIVICPSIIRPNKKILEVIVLISHHTSQEPGQQMSPGLHHVNYLAHDTAGNRAKCHFSVHVKGMHQHYLCALIQVP
jgi:hypothetical protein